MNRLSLVILLLVAILLGIAAALPFATTGAARRDLYFFDVDVSSTVDGHIQLFFDTGHGFNETESSRQPIRASAKVATYRFLLPTGTIQALRFDPIDREGTVTATLARITDRRRKVIHRFALSDFIPQNDIGELRDQNGSLVIKAKPGGNDPNLLLQLTEPLHLPYGLRQQLQVTTAPFFVTIVSVLLCALLAHVGQQKGLFDAVRAAARRRPKTSLAVLSALSVAIQLHPVLFCGKSFVSPDNPAFLLYHGFPTLPGYESEELENGKGADVGAMFYQHLAYPKLQREALFRDKELPLWNRYNLCGVPLLGQGQSMFGDVLNIIPMAGNSSAWSWDIKFALARWLFAFVLALIAWKLTRQLGPAAFVALVAVWIGFFAYRLNHPAIFSVCYAPLVLLSWILIQEASTRRQWIGSAICVFAAHWELLTSGTAKEAVIALLCMDLAGVLLILLSDAPWRDRRKRLAVGAAAGLVFLLVSTPLWLTFLDTLAVSRTSYDKPVVWQKPAWEFIGFFEDLLPRRLMPNEIQWNPSTNVIVLAGIALAVGSIVDFLRNRTFIAIAIASIVAAGFVFGLVPSGFILHVPLLKNVYYIDNAFGGALVSLFTVLSAFGFKWLVEQGHHPSYSFRIWVALGLILIPVCIYWAMTYREPISAFSRGYLPALAIVLGVSLIAALALRGCVGFQTAVLAVFVVFAIWRHGEYVKTPFDDYVFNPKVRATLEAKSPAVDRIRELLKEPSRPAGLGLNLFSGFGQIYDWEGIYGVDAVRSAFYDDLTTAGGVRKIRWWENPGFDKDSDDARPVMDLLNCRYYLGYPFQASDLPSLRHLGSFDLDVYESPTAWPRAFFVSRGVTVRSVKDVVEKARLAHGTPFAAIAEGDWAGANLSRNFLRPSSDVKTVPARDYRLTTNTTTFTIDAPSAGVVVLTETYYPRDFLVYLNEQPISYFRINYAFKGIEVKQPGTYLVRFEYWPHRLTLALWLSLSGVLLGIVLLAILSSTVKHSRQAPETASLL